MNMGVQVSATVGDGKTLEQFGKLIAKRIKYMGETSRDAIAACAVDALRSIRALTSKATRRSVVSDVEVKQEKSLYPSFRSEGGRKKLCLRFTGSKRQYRGKERVVQTSHAGSVKQQSVYRFVDANARAKKTAYLIVAPNLKEAEKKACGIRRARALQYAGLARTALSLLMRKTATVNDAGGADARLNAKASQFANRIERTSGDVYSLQLNDNLDYALQAVKGGSSGVGLALKKAANKIASVVNRRCADILGFGKLPPPFPEVRQRG